MSRIGPREPTRTQVEAGRSLADLLWVANTAHGPGGHWFARPSVGEPDHDHLRTADEAVRYLVDHGVRVPGGPPDPRHLAALASIRDMVRGLENSGGGWTPAALAIIEGATFRLDTGGRVAATGAGWDSFVGDLLLPLVALVRLRPRLAMCGNPDCRLVFLDASRSGTRRWCDEGGCGNRIRLRRHRDRHGASARS